MLLEVKTMNDNCYNFVPSKVQTNVSVSNSPQGNKNMTKDTDDITSIKKRRHSRFSLVYLVLARIYNAGY